MTFDMDNIFLPSVEVDMVFNMNSLASYSRASIIHDEKRKLRVGVECVQFRTIDKYQPSNKTNISAVVLNYTLPVTETNIRSAYRLPLSKKYAIKGKILYNKMEYSTSRNFSIRDISLAGLGLKIPKKKDNATNSLSSIKENEEIEIELKLIRMDQDTPIKKLKLKIKIVRIESDYSSTHSLMGVKILDLERNCENTLNKFIHDAQVEELKRLRKISL